jgi:hypothetical protein
MRYIPNELHLLRSESLRWTMSQIWGMSVAVVDGVRQGVSESQSRSHRRTTPALRHLQLSAKFGVSFSRKVSLDIGLPSGEESIQFNKYRPPRLDIQHGPSRTSALRSLLVRFPIDPAVEPHESPRPEPIGSMPMIALSTICALCGIYILWRKSDSLRRVVSHQYVL